MFLNNAFTVARSPSAVRPPALADLMPLVPLADDEPYDDVPPPTYRSEAFAEDLLECEPCAA
jgi:hypothetical protein